VKEIVIKNKFMAALIAVKKLGGPVMAEFSCFQGAAILAANLLLNAHARSLFSVLIHFISLQLKPIDIIFRALRYPNYTIIF
jgi:hypothetical protein